MSETSGHLTAQQLHQIQLMAKDIRFGSITLVFQDSHLVQIDKSEKIRLDKTNNKSKPAINKE